MQAQSRRRVWEVEAMDGVLERTNSAPYATQTADNYRNCLMGDYLLGTLRPFDNPQNCVRTYCMYQPSFKVIRTRSKTRYAHLQRMTGRGGMESTNRPKLAQ
jgi:hypothetical protein